jgi:hypothetical protein
MWGSFFAGVLERFYQDYAEKANLACNKPQADTQGGHSHVVKACYDGQEKLIRFGQAGVKGSPKKEGESESYRKRRESFMARHKKNIDKGPSSAAWWSAKTKW